MKDQGRWSDVETLSAEFDLHNLFSYHDKLGRQSASGQNGDSKSNTMSFEESR